MRRGPFWSIRWWLAGLVASVALPLLLLLTWIYGSEVQQEQGEARNTALRIARSTAASMRTLHYDAKALLHGIASRPALQALDASTCESLFPIVNFFPEYADVFLFDLSGRMVCSSDPESEARRVSAPAEDRRVSLAASRWITGELKQGHLQLAKPLIRPMEGGWVSVLAVPVTAADGSRRGTLAILQLPQEAGEERLPANTVITILDPEGTIVARTSDTERWSGQSARGNGVTDLALQLKEGVTEGKGIDGVSRQYGFTYLPELDWYVVVGVPSSTVMEPVRRMFLRGVGGGLIIMIIVIAAAIVIARAIERPIAKLAAAAKSVAKGAYGTVDLDEGPLEITTLGHVFNDMVASRSEAEAQLMEGERNLKAVSERLLMVQEEERSRIARELHDDLGQALTALKMDMIGLLGQAITPAASGPLRERIMRTLDSTVTAVQRISTELRPSVLDDLGVVAAIESEARIFEERTGIECELSLPGEVTIDKVSGGTIYRVVQEALTNVARHSNAARVELRLRQRTDELLLEIRDDGRGLTLAEASSSLSLGLIGIRERVELVGGTVQIEGIAGRGTIVSVRIPLDARARARA
jgi:signal transduction histidine kinase